MLPCILALLVLLAVGAPATAKSQGGDDSLRVRIVIDSVRFVSATTSIDVELSRPLDESEGRLVLVVGGTDVTAMSEHEPARLVYRPRLELLPAGRSEVVVYRAVNDVWIELQRMTLRALTSAGFRRVDAQAQGTIGNKGQLASGEVGQPPPERPTYQDLSFNGSFGTTHEHERFLIETSSTVVGSSRRNEALRYALRHDAAPRLDLADYRMSLRAGDARLTVGHTSFGASRHLVNHFSARGASLAWARGGTGISVAAMGAASTVGWDQLLPLGNSDHRVMAMSLSREVVPARPGALHVEATWLDARMLPRTAFTQAAVVDAEASDGGALQVSASTPGQRLRLTSGVSRSRFSNPPRDPQLTGDSILLAVRRETNGARFLEATVVPWQQRPIPGIGPANATVSVRHERVDPLYRSVVAYVQADRQHDGGDVSLQLGALSGQFALSRSRDNLAGVATLLTTRDRARTVNVAVPFAQLLHVRRGAAWLPTVSWTAQRTHQAGDDIPAGGVYTADQIPDHLSRARDVHTQWQVRSWRIGVRHHRATQDNRQPGRASADFASGVDALSIGRSIGTVGDVSLDLGDDFQLSRERNERSTTRRVTFNASVRRGQSTSLMLAWSVLRTKAEGPATTNAEQRVELTQPLVFFRDAQGGARGQAFLRFGHATARVHDFGQATLATRRQWAVTSGLNVRVF